MLEFALDKDLLETDVNETLDILLSIDMRLSIEDSVSESSSSGKVPGGAKAAMFSVSFIDEMKDHMNNLRTFNDGLLDVVSHCFLVTNIAITTRAHLLGFGHFIGFLFEFSQDWEILRDIFVQTVDDLR
jgi:hypothetical protein